MFATQVLPETLSDNVEDENDTEVVGFIVVENVKHEVRKGDTKIGRDSSMCSIVIDNSTVSKVHAVIESDGIDDTFIYDVGSTNQTRLGKKVLKANCRYKLSNDSSITLGSVTVKFIIPLDEILNDYNTGNCDELDEFGDIFDIATQAVPPQSSTSVSPFENQAKNIDTFKIPFPKTKKSPKSIFDCMTQGRLESQETAFKTENDNSSFDNSAIFNLSTQCQIYEPPVVKENKTKSSHEEVDEFKSLLNDGQDDVLCAVMSLHSPKEIDSNDMLKKIKNENENLSQILDAPTQVWGVVEEKGGELNGSLENNEVLCRPTVASTPLNSKLRLSSENNRDAAEDVIKTQEFKINESHKGYQPDRLSQDEETQCYMGETLIDISIIEQKDDEDFILTQSFDTSGKDHLSKKSESVIPESEDFNEDFMETQIFSVEKEIKVAEVVTDTRQPEPSVAIADLTQRSSEDDFIATQVFEEPIEAKNCIGNSEKNDPSDCEDFIATQVVELPMQQKTNSQEARIEPTSQESSPDLLAHGSSFKDSEDFDATQIFEPPECHNIRPSFCEKFQSAFSSEVKNDDCSPAKNKVPESEESSSDETESDLEILLDKNEVIREDNRILGSCHETEFEPIQNQTLIVSPASQNSNDSYVFQLQPENFSAEVQMEQNQQLNLSDSDATDCEEAAGLNLDFIMKQEPAEKSQAFEDTQVLTLTPTKNLVEKTPDNWMTADESPRIEIENDKEPWSPLSLEMPSTQEMETSVKTVPINIEKNETIVREKCKDLQASSSKVQKIEVRTDNSSGSSSFWQTEPLEKKVPSPKKRPRDSNEIQIEPVKKSKTEDKLLRSTEKQFLKLVQAHDIAQIQPNRTRNSLKNLKADVKPDITVESRTNNSRPPSRRKVTTKRGSAKKLNCDITPYLVKKGERPSSSGQNKDTSLVEKRGPKTPEGSARVLRSSKKNSLSPKNLIKAPERTVPSRMSKRNSRAKIKEYFTSPCVHVAFTGFECASFDKIISDLGGKKISDLSSGEVVVADKVRRTVKFLSAIGLSLPITSPEWLIASKNEKKFLDPWNFILKDEESEKKWDFELRTSLERAKKVKLFQGFNVFATRSTKPPVKDLLAIVECCGGTPLLEPPEVWPRKTIVVSCLEDQKFWPAAKVRNVQIVHYELILSGVLQQKIDLKKHKLR